MQGRTIQLDEVTRTHNCDSVSHDKIEVSNNSDPVPGYTVAADGVQPTVRTDFGYIFTFTGPHRKGLSHKEGGCKTMRATKI